MTPENMDLSETIRVLVDKGALFVACHSGGKDSQALLVVLKSIVPADQLLVLHADLAEVEWKGTLEHAKKDAGNLPFRVCKSETKTFLSMVEKRGMFPDPQRRQCTSDLKRGPMEKAIRHYLKAIEAAGTDAAPTVIAKMKATPVSDMFTKSGRVREDGRMVYDVKLLEAKTLAESKGEWDIYKTVAIVPGDQVFRPLAESPCPLVKK